MSNTIIYSTKFNIKGTIITFHGGCFSGGDTTYDKEQNILLCNLGYEIHQVYFPKKWIKFKLWCVSYSENLNKMVEPIFVLGRSSGGFLAKYFYEYHRDSISKAIYIAPVFKPFLRANIKNDFLDKTKLFFNDDIDNVDHLCKYYHIKNNQKLELIFLSKNDENVPLELFSKEQLENAIYFNNLSHNEILKCADDDFIQQIISFITINSKTNSNI